MSRHPALALAESDPLTLAAGTWLACGVVLLGLTPLPLHDATLGWSPAFWLLVAPSLLLIAKLACVSCPAFQPAAFRKSDRSYAATPFRFASIRRSNSRMMC